MLRPLESYDQRVLSSSLMISPEPTYLRNLHDVFGNCVGVARFGRLTRELVFDSRVRLEHSPLPAFADIDGEIEPYDATLPATYSVEDLPDLTRSMERQYPDPDGVVEAWAKGFVRHRGRTSLQSLLAEITQSIHADFRYATRLYGSPQTPAETLASKSGACRDFALLMMEAVRSLGLPAQFVSGYIYSPPLSVGGLTRVGGGHTHAWVRVYLPACGWVEFDPTNGIVGNADLIRVAIARDPRQAAPLWGAYVGEAEDFLDMEVEVEVTAEDETIPAALEILSPRTTSNRSAKRALS